MPKSLPVVLLLQGHAPFKRGIFAHPPAHSGSSHSARAQLIKALHIHSPAAIWLHKGDRAGQPHLPFRQ
jgi:hypothetical protein